MISLLAKKLSSSKSLAVLGLSIGIALGIASGIVLKTYYISKCNSNYAFVNSVEVCGKPDVIRKDEYTALRNALVSYLSKDKAAGHSTDASVYFRDLENGPVFSINENTDFAPASLLKLPLALVYLTQAENNPGLLDEQVSVAKPLWNFSEHYPPSETIDPAQPHTIRDLLARMIMYSDNNAYGVLQTHLYDIGQQDLIPQTFLELGFLDPNNITSEVMSVRQYAGIFRALYNISYLNAAFSNQVLAWLAQSDFNQGLRPGVPMDIKIAHKFGERFTDDGMKQLHDCGIVYYPGNPYLLCVMTRGTNFDDLSSSIQYISGMVYQEVDSRRLP
jgi:beta-lactamase class A